jgi:hypothetical protein
VVPCLRLARASCRDILVRGTNGWEEEGFCLIRELEEWMHVGERDIGIVV